MEEHSAVSSTNWSSLSTVQSIDTDHGITSQDVVPVNGDCIKPNMKSIFIESLVDQLCKLLEKDPRRRRKIYDGICSKLFEMQLIDKTYQFEELSSLRGHFQQAMINILRGPEPSIYKTPSSYPLEWSRYSNEYDEISIIASGGFGTVYKAKHYLDQVFYAIKKINVKFQNISLLIMGSNEVKTLAKLNHPNIVQYKAAWLEPLFSTNPDLPTVEYREVSSDSDDIVFENSSSSSSDLDEISSSQTHIESEKGWALCQYWKNSLNEVPQSQKTQSQVNAILYVSMQLCDETLRDWLSKRNLASNPVLDVSICIDIMIQATLGVDYIHSCNIVHHDIKPNNIFLSNNSKSIQVGDFGLSCCLQGQPHAKCPLQGGRFGTPLYSAPEQHKGQCNQKSDIFSLGLLFIELLSIFATEMERISVLTKCRSGFIPESVPNHFVPVIEKLISSDAEKRPTSGELLKELYKLRTKCCDTKNSLTITKTQVISFNETSEIDLINLSRDDSRLKELLRDKDKEIMELKLMLAKRDDEIAKLKKQIHNH